MKSGEKIRLRTVVEMRPIRQAGSNGRGCNQPTAKRNQLKILLSVLKSTSIDSLCKRALQVYQQLRGVEEGVHVVKSEAFINNNRLNLNSFVAEICQTMTEIRVIVRVRSSRSNFEGRSRQASNQYAPLSTFENSNRENLAEAISRIVAPLCKTEEQVVEPECRAPLTCDNHLLLQMFIKVDRLLEDLRQFRCKKAETFQAIQRSLFDNYLLQIEHRHLYRLLWLVPDLYNVYLDGTIMYISIPRAEQGSNNAAKRQSIVKRALQKWNEKHGDTPIPQKEMLPDLHKLSEPFNTRVPSIASKQELDPFSILEPEMRDGVFGRKLMEIVRRKQQLRECNTSLFNA